MRLLGWPARLPAAGSRFAPALKVGRLGDRDKSNRILGGRRHHGAEGKKPGPLPPRRIFERLRDEDSYTGG